LLVLDALNVKKSIRFLCVIALFFVFLCRLGGEALGQSAAPCEKIPIPKKMGESITFYVYTYHTNQFNEVLRVSNVYKVNYAFDPRVRGAHHGAISQRFGSEFENYVRGIRQDETASPHGLATSTQNAGVFICANREAVAEHRLGMIEEFEKWDKPVIEEQEFEFEFKFNIYQIEAGKTCEITVNKL